MASITSNLKRTFYIRHPDEQGQLIERGPFHHSHIRDLMDAGSMPEEVEVCSDAKPDWKPIQDHAIYLLVCPSGVKYGLQKPREITEEDNPKCETTAEDIVWTAMSQESQKKFHETRELNRKYDRKVNIYLRGAITLAKFAVMIYLPYAWLGFYMGVFVTLEKNVAVMSMGWLFLSIPPVVWFLARPFADMGIQFASTIERVTAMSIGSAYGGAAYLLSAAGFMIFVAIHMYLDRSRFKWHVACINQPIWGLLTLSAFYDATAYSMIGVLTVGLMSMGLFLGFIYSCYKMLYSDTKY